MENTTLSHRLIEYLIALDASTAYAAISVTLLLCGLGVPVPEDLSLIAAGILASKNVISYFGAFIVGYIGVLAGDVFLFFFGRTYGRRVFTFPFFRRIFTPERVALAEERIQKNARLICFTARFLPGLRAPIYLTAGVMRVHPGVFLFQDGLAALLSVPVVIYVGYWFGQNIENALAMAQRFNLAVGALAVSVVIFYVIKHYRNKKMIKGKI